MSLLLTPGQKIWQGVIEKDDSVIHPSLQFKMKEVWRWDVMQIHLWPRSGFIGSLDSSSSINLIYSDEDIYQYPEFDDYKSGSRYSLLYKIQGIAKDGNGNPLGNCLVKLFRTLDDTRVDQCITDTVGNYLLYTPYIIAGNTTEPHYCVLFQGDSMAGASARTLVGVP